MALSLLIIQQSAVLFIMVLFGFVLAKAKVVHENECGVLSRVTVYMFLPCLIFGSFLTKWSAEKMQGMVLAVAAAVIVHVVNIIFSSLVQKKLAITNLDVASLIYTNAGAIIIPLIAGTIGSEYVVYSSAYMMVQNILLWTHCVSLIGGRQAVQLKKILTNPALIAIALGLLTMALPFEMPAIIAQAAKDIGCCMAPVSMFQIGVVCAGFNWERLYKIRTVWITVALRLLVCPVITICVLALLHRLVSIPNSWEILFVIMLGAAGPSGVVVTQLSQIYRVEIDRSSCINVLTTALCALTFPLMTLIAQIIM